MSVDWPPHQRTPPIGLPARAGTGGRRVAALLVCLMMAAGAPTGALATLKVGPETKAGTDDPKAVSGKSGPAAAGKGTPGPGKAAPPKREDPPQREAGVPRDGAPKDTAGVRPKPADSAKANCSDELVTLSLGTLDLDEVERLRRKGCLPATQPAK